MTSDMESTDTATEGLEPEGAGEAEKAVAEAPAPQPPKPSVAPMSKRSSIPTMAIPSPCWAPTPWKTER